MKLCMQMGDGRQAGCLSVLQLGSSYTRKKKGVIFPSFQQLVFHSITFVTFVFFSFFLVFILYFTFKQNREEKLRKLDVSSLEK